jgi:hypothetical protein
MPAFDRVEPKDGEAKRGHRILRPSPRSRCGVAVDGQIRLGRRRRDRCWFRRGIPRSPGEVFLDECDDESPRVFGLGLGAGFPGDETNRGGHSVVVHEAAADVGVFLDVMWHLAACEHSLKLGCGAAQIAARFCSLAGIPADESVVLVLRFAVGPPASVPNRRSFDRARLPC